MKELILVSLIVVLAYLVGSVICHYVDGDIRARLRTDAENQIIWAAEWRASH